LAKPASAITRQTAAITSAIDATPLKVSIGLRSAATRAPSATETFKTGRAIPRWRRIGSKVLARLIGGPRRDSGRPPKLLAGAVVQAARTTDNSTK
jgi:hypothetical protein